MGAVLCQPIRGAEDDITITFTHIHTQSSAAALRMSVSTIHQSETREVISQEEVVVL